MSSMARRTVFALGTIALLLILNTISALYGLGWKSVTINTTLILLLDICYAWRYRDGHVVQWLLFGLSAGWVELFTDAWLVQTGTLLYPPDEPMIWLSPAYMPFAWTMVLTQIGLLGAWLRPRTSFLVATLLTALIAGINIPIYEHLAKGANWWFYHYTPMLFSAPYYVIAAEFLLALPLAGMASIVDKQRPLWSLAIGIVEGIWMLPATMVAFWVVGSCTQALIRLPCP